LVFAVAVSPVPPAAQPPSAPSEPVVERERVALIGSPAPAVEVPAVPQGRFGSPGGREGRRRVRELTEQRSATSEVWVHSDGTRSVRVHSEPRYFLPRGGGDRSWRPIETVVVADPDRAGWWRSKANRWSVSFGPAAADAGMLVFDLEGGAVSFAAVGANAGVVPDPVGSTVTYAGLWPEVDAVYAISAVGVDERLVLGSAGAPTVFSFDVFGAVPVPNAGGGLDLVADGEAAAVVPPLTVETSQGMVRPESAGARFVVEAGRSGSGGRITIVIDRGWLSGLPADAFPVVIDPTVRASPGSTTAKSFRSGATGLSGVAQAGVASNLQVWRGAAFVPIPNPAQIMPGGSQPWHLVDAVMRLYRVSGSTGTCVCSLAAIGEPLEPTTFASVVDQPGSQVLQPIESGVGDFAFDVKSWIASRRAGASGSWYGFVGDENPAHGSNLHVLRNASSNGISIEYFYFQSSDPTQLVSPSGTISTTTPLLRAEVVEPADPDSAFDTVYYRFKISTEASGAGSVIDSGWIESSSWAVPASALADGGTYHVRVWNNIGFPWGAPGSYGYFPPAEPTVVKTLTVKQRLGAGGPSPTDTVGAVPGSTGTPSKGAPSPGVGGASVTVNMMTRNLALTVNTRTLGTLSGAAGVSLSYDSLGSSGLQGGARGLNGRYLVDGVLVGRRIDPNIDFAWAGSPMGGYSSATGPVTAEWNGTITVPAAQGQWQLGGTVASGTMKIYLDGSSNPYRTITSTTPTFGLPRAWAAGTVVAIRVEYTSAGARGSSCGHATPAPIPV
jgi:hypothetical protein